MTDPHDQWIQNTLQPLRDVLPSPRQAEIRAQWLAEIVSDVALSRPNEQVTHTKKERSMFIVNRNRTLAASVALVLGIFVSFFVSPNLRAIAQEILDTFFVRAESNVKEDSITIHYANSSEMAVFYEERQLTLEEAEERLGYSLTLPDDIPDAYILEYVVLETYSEGFSAPIAQYICRLGVGAWGLAVTHETIDAPTFMGGSPSVGADALIEKVELGNGITGEYVRGMWTFPHPITPPAESDASVPVTSTWSNEENAHHLRWTMGGKNYDILGTGATQDTSTCTLTKDDIIRIAQEIVSQTPDATPSGDAEGMDDGFFVREESDVKDTRLYLHYNLTAEDRAYYEERELTLDEAQTALGYNLVLPSVPIGYRLKYVVLERFEGSSDFVAPIAQYTCEIGGGVFSIIHQSSDSPQFIGGETSVGANALVRTVSLGEDVEGELVKGMWDFPDVIPTPDAEGNVNYPVESGGFVPITTTWNNDVDAFELRWTSYGKHYQIFANGGIHQEYRCKITKMDVIRMAREIAKAEASN